MNEIEIEQIEQQLRISIPSAYKSLFQSKLGRLRDVGAFNSSLSSLFLQPDLVLKWNQLEREKGAGTRGAFPTWWKNYFLIGTNGGGDFYCLRLDGSPEVWMIGSDCGDEPTLIASSLETFVDEEIDEYTEAQEAEKQVELENDRRREPFEPEFAAHRRVIDQSRDMVVAEAWFGATSSYRLLRALANLPFKVSPRKLRLLGIVGCKRIKACQQDSELAAAIELAERLSIGTATQAEVKATVAALKVRREESLYSSDRWPVTAVHSLFQDDADYLKASPVYEFDPNLTEVFEAINYALYGSPQGTIVECTDFWEVLGFPFLEVTVNPAWRSPAVMTLASQIDQMQDFSQMPKLAQLLLEAGCDDSRLITHCQRVSGHFPGSWVIDLILEKERSPFELEFTWDFECAHDKIDAEKLKEKIKQFGTTNQSSRDDIGTRLEFADWVQEQGDTQWATYIRVRCAQDDSAPGENYADLVEEQIESALDMTFRIRYQDFFSSDELVADDWWSNESIDYHRGLPSMVNAVSPGEESAGPYSVLVQRLHALMQKTPVRGVDFGEYCVQDMDEIFTSNAMRELRFLVFENCKKQGVVSPAIAALSRATFASELEYLGIEDGLHSDEEVLLLAKTPFKSLRRLDMKYGEINCSANAAKELMTSSWFKQLRQLNCGIGDECAKVAIQELQKMDRLHSLSLYRLPALTVQAFDSDDPMPSLRRLAVLQAELTGDACSAFASLALPALMDLSLQGCGIKKPDFNKIFTSPLTHGLQALRIRESGMNESSLSVLASNPCASRLRILELECGDDNLNGKFKSLGTSALAGDTFASLTTLKISHPFTSRAKSDTAQLLHRLAAPNLRHLTLEDCDIDDECAVALAHNSSFASLTRLILSQKYTSTTLLRPKSAETLFRSSNMRNLLELELNQFKLGNAVKFLCDETVLPNLKSAALWGTQSSDKTQALIKQTRSAVYVGS